MNVSRRMEQKSAGTLTGKILHQLSDLVKRPSYPQKMAVCFRDTVDPKPQPFRKTDSSQKITGEKASLLYMKKQAQTCICTSEPVAKTIVFILLPALACGSQAYGWDCEDY